MKLAIFQFEPAWGDKETNLEKICDTLSDYAGVNLWVLPELCTTGYQFTSNKEISDLAEEFPAGKTSEEIKSLSKKIKSTIVLGVLEKAEHGIFNSAAVFDQGDFLGIYRKIHLFNEEKKWFLPGTTATPVFNIRCIRVGVMICFDWIFPEIARTLALRGAQVIAHPSNLVLPYCQDAMITRSIENRVFTATANRIGTESRGSNSPVTFTGQSQITNPEGKILGKLSKDEENTLVIDINPDEALDKFVTPLNDIFKDRKPSLYINE